MNIKDKYEVESINTKETYDWLLHKHYAKRIDLGNKYIHNILDNFEKKGERYPKIRSVFFQGFYGH